jgi:hypothetical protein
MARALGRLQVTVQSLYGRTQQRPGTLATMSYHMYYSNFSRTRLVIMSIPFLAFPRFLLFLSSMNDVTGEHRDYLTPLESFLSTHFAILALSSAIGIVFSVRRVYGR